MTTTTTKRMLTCLKCNGDGWIRGKPRLWAGHLYPTIGVCPVCQGRGQVNIVPDAKERAAKEDYFE